MNIQTINSLAPRLLTILICSAISLFLSMPLLAADDEHGGADQHETELVVMPLERAQSMGVITRPVTAGQLNITATVYGTIVTDPASLSHIRARFDGIVTQVNGNLGHKVKKDETLAIVESNESLKSYPVLAPLSGTVIARHANAGELSNGQVLFSVANYDDVLAQLKLFPNKLSEINPQQHVLLSLADSIQDSTIQYILPSPEEQPYVLAYAKMDNTSGRWPVGAAIKGLITTKRVDAAIQIPKTAIQEYEGTSVVFVKQGDEYHPRPVTLGIQDNTNIEVLAGLSIADEIVIENSYLFKADLEKSEAGYAH